MTFLRTLIEQLKDEDLSIADDGTSAAEIAGYIDTGSYLLNALVSGSMYLGIPDTKVTGFAGESATGKTYFVLGLVKAFLNQYPEGVVVYFDSESAVTKQMMKERGVDTARVIIAEPITIQQFRTKAMALIDAYMEKKNAPRMLFVLDSLGQLSTEKELADIAEGKDARDMTRSQLIRGTFRALQVKLARAKIPLLITNHVYEVVGSYVPTKELSGGSGFKYAASTIITLAKSKERDDKTKEIVGSKIKATTYKSRLTRDNQSAELLLTHEAGLDRYYGLIDLGLKHGVFKKLAKGIEWVDGKQRYEREIYGNPEKYFTPDVMEKLEQAAQKEFKYGTGEGPEDEVNEE